MMFIEGSPVKGEEGCLPLHYSKNLFIWGTDGEIRLMSIVNDDEVERINSEIRKADLTGMPGATIQSLISDLKVSAITNVDFEDIAGEALTGKLGIPVYADEGSELYRHLTGEDTLHY